MRIHETRTRVPSGFSTLGPADPDTLLKIRLALKRRNVGGLIEALYRVSNPSHSEYGHFLSNAEVTSFMAPTPETMAAVSSWLTENAITARTVSPAGDWLEFTVSVEKANALFDANFTTFRHTASKTQGIRTLQYSLPSSLQPHVELLFPGVSFWSPLTPPKHTAIKVANATRRRMPAKRQFPPCSEIITPSCLQQFYGIPAAPATQVSSTLAVSGFIEEYANQADLSTFLELLRPDIPQGTFDTQLLDNGQNPQDLEEAGVEAGLDTQYTVGVATGVPVTFISVGPDSSDDLFGFADIINFLASEAPSQPKVLTTSYGANEDAVSPLLFKALCDSYAALGVQGTSVIFSSGDGGVAGIQPTFCLNGFIPTFPSGCPFVTSVGSTAGVPPETAAGFSSGGFSNVFTTASYQSAAVAGYLSQIGGLNGGLYNASGRGFPDVSLAGVGFAIAFQGQFFLVDGTSASAPSFASMIALINDRRAAAGIQPLGFLNPFLYANALAFNDITVGNNPGCNTEGFPALGGWDPITGLGTPNFAALATAAGV
ncbi:family S53 protease-like protein [Auricularia subglabra TFB-10046 SS5]|nr:family S53 protease-like protein [Auricularia subglabra TFB-10046 SS5]